MVPQVDEQISRTRNQARASSAPAVRPSPIDIRMEDAWRDGASWDQFVENHPESRYCHLYGYGQVLSCYGYSPRNLCFLRDDTVVAVLPSAEVNSLLLPRRIVSQPFSEFGGLLVDDSVTEAEFSAIARMLAEYLARRPALRAIEMHGNHGVPAAWRDRFTTGPNPHAIAVLSLVPDTDHLWNTTIRYSVRKAVKQALDHGLRIERCCDESTLRRHFFPLYLKSMKRLGVPPHDIQYFLRSAEIFGAKMQLFLAYSNDDAIAGLLGFCCGGRINIINTVSDPDNWHLRPNDLLHWEFIKWGAETGFQFFDFGSVRYEGQATFKKKWGCEMVEHKTYLAYSPGGRQVPVTVNSSSGRMAQVASLWSSYMPPSLARLSGPMIRKHLAR